jgi:hypothetical protein
VSMFSSEERRRALWLSVRHIRAQSAHGSQPTHKLYAQGPWELSSTRARSHLGCFHGETRNEMEIGLYPTHPYIPHPRFLSHIGIQDYLLIPMILVGHARTMGSSSSEHPLPPKKTV